MQYMGSKNRHAKEILPIILKNREEKQWYYEPFVGGCNMIDKVNGRRLANDNHAELIEMWKALQTGWIPPEFVSEDDYEAAKTTTDLILKAYIGFSFSFGAKYFGGYTRHIKGTKGNLENMKKESARAFKGIMKQVPFIKDVFFLNKDYSIVHPPDNSIIYCDPPYEGTTKYKGGFDHEKFWNWVRGMSKANKVFVSEYAAPDDFECIWSKDVKTSLNSSGKTSVEKLFKMKQ